VEQVDWENKRNQMSTERVPKLEDMATTVLAPVLTPAAHALRRDDDRELVRLAKRDDQEAFELLVKRHQSRVFAVARGILRNKEDVEDVAQQVFVKAYFSLKKFDQRAAFSTWLYKITVNECWDVLRKKKSRPLYFEAELSEEQARQYKASEDVESPGTDVSDRMASRQRVEQLLGFLDERDRAMLVLKEVQGFSVEEIAEMMEINGNTVKVRLFRARRRITDRLKRGAQE
jgi:RNA polymerase sigma-70 factor (ECF subfamily)